MLARDIDHVVHLLDQEIASAVRSRDPHGIFVALYRQMTVRVRDGIRDGLFDDGERMDRFDTLFANRYFLARDRWAQREAPTKSWRVAFLGAQDCDAIALQHMLLGVNAHINLDLAIAAADTVPAEEITDLQDDFDRINDIIAVLLDEAQGVLGRHSRGMRLIDLLGGPIDEWFGVFSIEKMRQRAWEGALELSGVPSHARQRQITLLDRQVSFLGRSIHHPPRVIQAAVDLVRAGESHDVPAIIRDLSGLPSV